MVEQKNVECELKTFGADTWDGIRFDSDFKKDDVYVMKVEAVSENDNSLLEVIVPTLTGETKIVSYIVGKTFDEQAKYNVTEDGLKLTRELTFAFSPLTGYNTISLRMSSYSGFSSGKINIKKILISNLFPIENKNDLKEKIKFLGPWFHQLDLMGLKTREIFKTKGPFYQKGSDKNDSVKQDNNLNNPNWIWNKFKEDLPKDLKSKNILDVACNCGFYSFELAKRGAKVIAIDNSYEDIVRAKFAKKVMGSENVDFKFCPIEELTKIFTSKFDLVLCLGLLYHMEDPEYAINTISEITDTAIFETIADVTKNSNELVRNTNITNDGYLPTIPWLYDKFKKAGFVSIKRITPPEFGRNAFLCKKS